MSFSLLSLDAIERADLGNVRLQMLKAHDSKELRNLLNWALSPDITFGIKTLPDYENSAGERFSDDEHWYRELNRLLTRLSERELTGHDARDAVARFLSICDGNLQEKWTTRILKQDLRINVGIKDINKTLGKQTIKVFEVPLATDYNKVKDRDLEDEWFIQPKLDGVRVVAVLPTGCGRVKLLSRTGKEWDNFESVRAGLQEYNNSRQGPTIYLDGEVVSKLDGKVDFQALQKTMNRDDGVEIGALSYMVFDAALEDEWFEPTQKYGERFGFLKDIFNNHIPNSELIKCDNLLVSSAASIRDELKSWGNAFVREGFEGAMVRSVNAVVSNKRTKHLLKVKTFEDAEAEIVDEVEGTGRYVGMLGAFVCKAANGKLFEVGSGLADVQRKDFWHKMIGRKLTYKFQNLTDDGLPRFPIFKCVRDDRDTA